MRITIPKPAGGLVWAVLLSIFLLFFVAVAVSNLCNGIARIASILWLVLMAAILAGTWRVHGTRRFLADILGAFSCKHFAEIGGTDGDSPEVRFGFTALGRCWFYQVVKVSKIESLEWSPGQATSLAGRDMNDWHVVLWFDHDDPVKSEKQKKWHRKPDQDLYIIGPSREKQLTAAFGREVLALLANAGAVLIPAGDDCTFVRAPDSRPRDVDGESWMAKRKTTREGVPYQTYISSTLHKLVTGRLKEESE